MQIFFMATSTKRQRIALVHCKEALMSLLKVAITVAALTIGPAIAAAQPQDRPPAVSPTRPAAPIAEQPPRNTEPSPATGRDPRRDARTPKATKSDATVWDQTKAMTRKQWNKARKTWARNETSGATATASPAPGSSALLRAGASLQAA
jgi:hypothetical protein